MFCSKSQVDFAQVWFRSFKVCPPVCVWIETEPPCLQYAPQLSLFGFMSSIVQPLPVPVTLIMWPIIHIVFSGVILFVRFNLFLCHSSGRTSVHVHPVHTETLLLFSLFSGRSLSVVFSIPLPVCHFLPELLCQGSNWSLFLSGKWILIYWFTIWIYDLVISIYQKLDFLSQNLDS